MRTNLVDSLRHRLARCVSDGAGDNGDITRRVRAVYREWKTQHIDDQLDDVFRYAYAGGLTAMIAPDTSVMWFVDPAQRVAPTAKTTRWPVRYLSGLSSPPGIRQRQLTPVAAASRCQPRSNLSGVMRRSSDLSSQRRVPRIPGGRCSSQLA